MRLTEDQHKSIDYLINEGVLSNFQIAKQIGCSEHTVWIRRATKDTEIQQKIREDFKIGEPVYKGGGEW